MCYKHLIQPAGLLVGTRGKPAGFYFGMAQYAARGHLRSARGLTKPDSDLGRSAIWLISARTDPPNYVAGSAGLARGQPEPARLAPLGSTACK
jgi:hypothetical protein